MSRLSTSGAAEAKNCALQEIEFVRRGERRNNTVGKGRPEKILAISERNVVHVCTRPQVQDWSVCPKVEYHSAPRKDRRTWRGQEPNSQPRHPEPCQNRRRR